MKKALLISLLLFAFILTLIFANAFFVLDAVEACEGVLRTFDEETPPGAEEILSLKMAFEKNRLLLSVSVPASDIMAYEAAIADLETAARAEEPIAYAAAKAQASLALTQIKKTALLSAEQLF